MATCSVPLSRLARSLPSSAIRDLLRLVDRPDVISLAGGLPAPDLFPAERLAEAASRAVASSGRLGPPALQYGTTEGLAELREVVRTWSPARSADDVLVTTGSQQALDLVAHALVDPGEVVVVERPTYLGFLQAVAPCEPRVVGVGSDRDGMRTDELEERLRSGLRPSLVYVVPSFANPSGATLSDERRRHLVDLAERYGFAVVEDDPYRELGIDGHPPAPLGTSSDAVVTVGSASKVLAPGLRVGWAVAPKPLREALVRIKQARDLHTPTISQAVAADVLGDGDFMASHLATLRDGYRTRRNALSAALARAFGDALHIDLPAGGMFLWACHPGLDAAALLPAALAQGVAFVPGVVFGTGDEAHGLRDRFRLSYATATPAELIEASGRLASAVGEVRSLP
jgi:2-aminoadipate transaminase